MRLSIGVSSPLLLMNAVDSTVPPLPKHKRVSQESKVKGQIES